MPNPETSLRLDMPFIQPAQAQKHVTHNEALHLLDAVVQLAVTSRSLVLPPASAPDGARYLVPAGAGGDWLGQAGRLALRENDAWQFLAPRAGWLTMVLDEDRLLFFDGSDWRLPDTVPPILPQLGIQTSADATNRFALAADASLFTHAGTGHQIKLNKASAGQTGSLLFQTGFSGRAELGLAGSDDFSVKVSADGAAWSDALVIASGSGEVQIAQGLSVAGPVTGTAITQSPRDATAGRLLKTGDSAALLAASPLLRVGVGGSANALSLTTGAGYDGTPPEGMALRFRASAANTGATTIALDGGTALPARTVTGAALPAGYIRSDCDTSARFENGIWVLSRTAETGSTPDGRFERLETGLLRVWSLRETSSASAASLWTFPVPMVTLHQVSASASAPTPRLATTHDATVTGCAFDAWNTSGTRLQGVAVALTAIGQWY